MRRRAEGSGVRTELALELEDARTLVHDDLMRDLQLLEEDEREHAASTSDPVDPT